MMQHQMNSKNQTQYNLKKAEYYNSQNAVKKPQQ